MALPINTYTRTAHNNDLLLEIEEHGTPLRINGQAETYYVLSAAQLMQLIGQLPADATEPEDISSFTPEDFGLTENELTAYEARRTARRQHVDADVQEPIAADLERRLRALSRRTRDNGQSRHDEIARGQLLQELETAMLETLQAAIRKIA